MNWKRSPFQVKIIGQEPERRGASLTAASWPAGRFVSFWISPLGQVMRTVSAPVCPPRPKTSGTPW